MKQRQSNDYTLEEVFIDHEKSSVFFESDSNNEYIESSRVNNQINEYDYFDLDQEEVFIIKKPFSQIETKITVYDVAAYILYQLGKISSMKLQKLVYYCQAWSLVWDEKPLFSEAIHAWANGPVVVELFYQLKGLYLVEEKDLTIGNFKKLNKIERETIDSVLKHYGDKSAQWLIELTHLEKPWRDARKGLPVDQRSNRIIELESIAEYYSSL